MNNNYLEIMKDALEKKIEVLDEILVQNEIQDSVLNAEEMDYDAFESTIDKKEKCIEMLNELDDGFQSLYDRVNEELRTNKEVYKEQIKGLQEYIKIITEKSMDIQRGEKRNKESFQKQMVMSRKGVRTVKTANRVAANYYQNMNKLNVVDSQFLDTKK